MKKIHTFAILNPTYETVWGKIIDKITESGISILQMRLEKLEDELVDKIFYDKVHQSNYPLFQAMMTSSPAIIMELQGEDVINKWLELIGPTNKEVAVEQFPDSFTAQYARSTNEPVCHGSANIEAAVDELTLIYGTCPRRMIPRLKHADFDEDKKEELDEIESICDKYENGDYSIAGLKQNYLEATVMPLLLEGISWIINERPRDPVEHLAMFLIKNNPIKEKHSKSSRRPKSPSPPPPPVETKKKSRSKSRSKGREEKHEKSKSHHHCHHSKKK